MWIAVLSGLLVSIDALFIGVSFGSQKRCRLWHVLVINAFLVGLCFVGYALGVWIGDSVDIELDIVIGILFILLGSWTIVYYFAFERRKVLKCVCKPLAGTIDEIEAEDSPVAAAEVCDCSGVQPQKKLPTKNTVLTGLFMSIEALFITIGLTLILDTVTFLIPLTVGLAHLVYCVVTFFFAKYLRRLPAMAGPIAAGAALIVYGILAFVL